MKTNLLSAVVAAMLVAGCGATKYVTATQTVTQTTTDTVTHRVRQHAPAHTVSVTATVTRTATATASASTAGSSASGDAGGPGTYHGNGLQNVGTITVSAPSTLRWACSGCQSFAIVSGFNGQGSISLSSSVTSGRTAVDPGTYNDVQVFTEGDWAFRITPG